MSRIDARVLLAVVGSFVVLLVQGASGARAETLSEHSWCGTGSTSLAEKVAIHHEHSRRLELRRELGLALRAETEAARIGDVAVLVDHGDIVVPSNQLDLSDSVVEFVPRNGGLVVSRYAEPFSGNLSGNLGERISLADDQARLIAFPKGFRFPFFGRPRFRMYVHSDGTISFEAPDETNQTPRSLTRLLAGPARVAPLFADFDPSVAPGDGGVYVAMSKASVVVTWLDVPMFGTGDTNTFQATLYPNGRIVFAYERLDSGEGVVGVVPGRSGNVQLVDFTGGLPRGVVRSGIAERFFAERVVNDLGIANAFFREFGDVDQLIVFLDFPDLLDEGVLAYEITLKNEVRGIGSPLYDTSAVAGSRGRLRSFVQMGSISKYADDPNAQAVRTMSTLDVVAHEAGHRWLAVLRFVDGGGQVSDAMLGRQRAHWSFCLHTEASVMEGNEFRDDGGGAYTTIAATDRYSPLDQYAMGLIPPSAVPPFYLIEGCRAREAAPQIGIQVAGNRVDIGVDQVIAAEGARVPTAAKAPKTFSVAFVIVGENGAFPSEQAIARVDAIRAAFEPYFFDATDGRGRVTTALTTRRR